MSEMIGEALEFRLGGSAVVTVPGDLLSALKSMSSGKPLAGGVNVGAMVETAETYFRESCEEGTLVYRTQHGIYTEPVFDMTELVAQASEILAGQGIAPSAATDAQISAAAAQVGLDWNLLAACLRGKIGAYNKAIVCSQFAQALITGTRFENSRYAQSANQASWWGYGYDSTTSAEFDGKNHDYLTANQMALYFRDKGLLHTFDAGTQDIRPGDVLFWSDPEYTSFFENIYHVAVCVSTFDNGCIILHASDNTARYANDASCEKLGAFAGINNDMVFYVDSTDAFPKILTLGGAMTKPSHYAHLPLIDVPYKDQLYYLDDAKYTGTAQYESEPAAGDTDVGELAHAITFGTTSDPGLPMGMYTLTWKDSGSGNQLRWKSKKIWRTYFPHKDGDRYSCVFYVKSRVHTIELLTENGADFEISEIRLYQGYHEA